MVAPSGSRKFAWPAARDEWLGPSHHDKNAAGAPAEAEGSVENKCAAVKCVPWQVLHWTMRCSFPGAAAAGGAQEAERPLVNGTLQMKPIPASPFALQVQRGSPVR